MVWTLTYPCMRVRVVITNLASMRGELAVHWNLKETFCAEQGQERCRNRLNASSLFWSESDQNQPIHPYTHWWYSPWLTQVAFKVVWTSLTRVCSTIDHCCSKVFWNPQKYQHDPTRSSKIQQAFRFPCTDRLASTFARSAQRPPRSAASARTARLEVSQCTNQFAKERFDKDHLKLGYRIRRMRRICCRVFVWSWAACSNCFVKTSGCQRST